MPIFSKKSQKLGLLIMLRLALSGQSVNTELTYFSVQVMCIAIQDEVENFVLLKAFLFMLDFNSFYYV